MKQIQMEATLRTATKKNKVGRLRAQNVVPAVLYGRGEPSVNLEMTTKQVHQLLTTSQGLNVLVTLSIQGGEQLRQETVIIKGVQRHPVSSEVMHVDFMKISLEQKLETKVPVVLAGVAPGIKEGGILELVHRELTVRCLPTMIPEAITLDISALGIGDGITVASLPAQEGIEILVAPHETIVHVVAPKMEEEKPAEVAVTAEGAPVEAAAAPAEIKEPEVIGEKEREERRAEKKKEKENV
jgi:large subunit ribosomal protein L25